jgi:hypothetical protein
MREKNKQPGSRRSKREAARAAAGEWAEHSRKQRGRKSITDRNALHSERKQAYRLPLPPPPSDWALFRFPEELDVFSQELMHQCM